MDLILAARACSMTKGLPEMRSVSNGFTFSRNLTSMMPVLHSGQVCRAQSGANTAF